ncbi:MAG: hypothetical protein ACRCX8_10925 [Sarcina sp.]
METKKGPLQNVWVRFIIIILVINLLVGIDIPTLSTIEMFIVGIISAVIAYIICFLLPTLINKRHS